MRRAPSREGPTRTAKGARIQARPWKMQPTRQRLVFGRLYLEPCRLHQRRLFFGQLHVGQQQLAAVAAAVAQALLSELPSAPWLVAVG